MTLKEVLVPEGLVQAAVFMEYDAFREGIDVNGLPPVPEKTALEKMVEEIRARLPKRSRPETTYKPRVVSRPY